MSLPVSERVSEHLPLRVRRRCPAAAGVFGKRSFSEHGSAVSTANPIAKQALVHGFSSSLVVEGGWVGM